jgi:hypothetical protein
MTQDKKTNRRTLGVVLGLIFLFALVMGAGPGINLVNPDPADPAAKFTIFGGVPVIYAWVMLWYVVEAAVAIIAYFYLWKDE